MTVLRKNGKKLAVDPARREPAEVLRAEFEGSMGKLGPLKERTLADGRADRRDDVQAVRSDGRGDQDCGRKQLNQLARISIITFRTSSILSDLMRPVLYRIILQSAVNIRFGRILLIFRRYPSSKSDSFMGTAYLSLNC